MKKTHAAKQTLQDINPDVAIETYTYNITTMENFDHFLSTLKTGKC
jgi:ubiquitin-like modifier-activating enzyme 5